MTEGLVLIVCTANLVRSPVAEAAFNGWLDGQKERPLVFASAGLATVDGEAVPKELIQEIRPFFLDLHDHRSRSVSRDDVRRAALVLAMTEDHRETLRSLLPSATPRIFTLREFARLSKECPTLSEQDDDVVAYVTAVHRQRPRTPAAKAAEDIVDAFGSTTARRQAVVAEVVEQVGRITERLC